MLQDTQVTMARQNKTVEASWVGRISGGPFLQLFEGIILRDPSSLPRQQDHRVSIQMG